MSKYSLDPIAANCYTGTTVLINKFGIREEEKLIQAEIAVTQIAIASWELSPQCDTFDFEHYRTIHKHLCLQKEGVLWILKQVRINAISTPCAASGTNKGYPQ